MCEEDCKLKEPLAKQTSQYDDDPKSLDDVDNEGEHQWNLNSVSVVCMKGYDWNDSISTRQTLAGALDPFFLQICIALLTLTISILMAVILFGLHDQFIALRRRYSANSKA